MSDEGYRGTVYASALVETRLCQIAQVEESEAANLTTEERDKLARDRVGLLFTIATADAMTTHVLHEEADIGQLAVSALGVLTYILPEDHPKRQSIITFLEENFPRKQDEKRGDADGGV